MVIEKVHGLQATKISLNDRFTILASAATINNVLKPRRRPSRLFSFNHNVNNNVLLDQIAYRLGQQARRQTVRQRLGMPGLRRFGSESNLIGLQRSNSFNNLNQNSIKNRVAWRQSNTNLNRSSLFSNVSQGVWRGRGFRRRGGRMGVMNMRGKMRGRGGRAGRSRSAAPRAARGRGGVNRQQKKLPTKEELDLQLDQYMASTKYALDQELDVYMKSAMDLE